MRYIIIFVIAFVIISLAKNYIRSRDKEKSLLSENDTLDEQFNAQKKIKELEIDKILEKVAEKGIDSLSTKELQKLDDYS